MLRVFSEILPPTEGTVEVSGSLHSIMSISTGLIMSASCSQNIKLKGFSYGLHGDALQDYMEEVKKRSNLDTFLYQPVKSLSAGMRSKLIISMLRGLNPNILIIDEWINVADNRQTDKEHSLAKAIRDTDIFTLATHNRKLITTHCNKCIVLDKGACVHFGEIALGFEILDQLEKTAS